MRALSVKQPWAWAFFHAGKDVENRSRKTHHRGTLAIHASKSFDPAEYQAAAREIWRITGAYPPPSEDLPRGCVIGFVEVVDCIEQSTSPWAMRGYCHWQLRNPQTCPPFPVRGQQQIFLLSRFA